MAMYDGLCTVSRSMSRGVGGVFVVGVIVSTGGVAQGLRGVPLDYVLGFSKKKSLICLWMCTQLGFNASFEVRAHAWIDLMPLGVNFKAKRKRYFVSHRTSSSTVWFFGSIIYGSIDSSRIVSYFEVCK